MKNYISLLVLLFLFVCIPLNVFAHPGRTDSNGCHYCRTNCAKWGLYNGQYHCHNGSSSSNSSNSNNNFIVKEKSNVNTIEKIIIEGEEFAIIEGENISYTTNKESIEVTAELTDNLADYDVNGFESLMIGYNLCSILVTAEDGSKKEYSVNVYRKSNDTNVDIYLDGEKLIFSNNKAEYDVGSSVESVEVTYELSDENATIEVDDFSLIEEGKNDFYIVVTAEDGTVKEYKITINKSSASEDFISTVLGFGIVGGIGYGIYASNKKKQ